MGLINFFKPTRGKIIVFIALFVISIISFFSLYSANIFPFFSAFFLILNSVTVLFSLLLFALRETFTLPEGFIGYFIFLIVHVCWLYFLASIIVFVFNIIQKSKKFVSSGLAKNIALTAILVNVVSHIFRIMFPYSQLKEHGIIEFILQIFADKLRAHLPRPFDLIYIAEMVFILSILAYGLIKKRKWAAPLGVLSLVSLIFSNMVAIGLFVAQRDSIFYGMFYLILEGPIYYLPALLLNFIGLIFLIIYISKEKEMQKSFSINYFRSLNFKPIIFLIIIVSIFFVGFSYAEDICKFGMTIGRYNEYTGADCFSTIAIMKNDVNICEKTPTRDLIETTICKCKENYAIHELKPEVCSDCPREKTCRRMVSEADAKRIRNLNN